MLSDDQQKAYDSFAEFAASDETVMAILGYAGSGKSYLYAQLAPLMQGQALMATPTHKATNVIRRNLRAAGIPFEAGYDQNSHVHGRLITGTTAQLVGIQPVISDDQSADDRTFSKASSGLLGRLRGAVDWVVVDEVSMLCADHMLLLEASAMEAGSKVLVLGDPGQLPPVNAEPIDWAGLPRVAVLEQIMRQSGDSAIPVLAQAVRTGADWRRVTGPGVVHAKRPGAAFLDGLQGPAATDERQRDVFIAYTNRVVDEVQELACQEVYGHGRYRFEPGQVVISESRIEAEVMTYLPKYGRSYPRPSVAANNADELVVLEFGDRGRWGTVVELTRADDHAVRFAAEYLTPEERSDRRHPYNVALQAAFQEANALQAEWTAGGRKDFGLDGRRKAAWTRAFELKDRTVISFRHPFAITSHKSQGSTYRTAFVDAGDIERFDARGLYVAATRPAEELVIG